MNIAAKSLIFFALDSRENFVQKDRMKIGYARVSTEEQNLDLRTEVLAEAGCDRIVTDQTQSGATAAHSRAGFSETMGLLAEDDLMVVWKLDRIGRSIADLIHLSQPDGRDRHDNCGRPVFHIMGALAEFKRDLIQERTKAGLRATKKHRKRPGKLLPSPPPGLPMQKQPSKRETVSGRSGILGVNRSTLQHAMDGASL